MVTQAAHIQAESAKVEQEAAVVETEFEEQIRDLSVFLQAQATVLESGGAESLQGASLVGVGDAKVKRHRKRK